MAKHQIYEDYPLPIILLANLNTLGIYLFGSLVMAGFGWLAVVLYLCYCLWLEVRLLMKSCVNCYYYGKLCFSGHGLLCSAFFKRGDPLIFNCTPITWKQLIPDFLLALVPLAVGLYLTFVDLNWLRLIYMTVIFVLAFPGAGYLHTKIACPHCRQREMGCPATEFFGGKGQNPKLEYRNSKEIRL